ncbi:thioredoxin-like protein [Lipomyces arxii]|uniref:thioredoxin-like protein n=1 Tax=Lipomyces arxii TaxID=56418 RepID=UPI0034CDD6BB
MDSTTVGVLDRYTDALISKHNEDDDAGSVEDDEFLDLLDEDDEALNYLREKRMQELHEQMKSAKRLHDSGHGVLTEVASEKEVLEITTTTKYTVVHFFHPSFKRCEIMQSRLKSLTAKHMNTRFISVNVDNATFLVVRLGIQVLPCVMSFIDGKEVGRIVGFDSLGNTDDFAPSLLELQLQKCGVIEHKLGKLQEAKPTVLGFAKKVESDDDYDWD